jgi:hypothetical protein
MALCDGDAYRRVALVLRHQVREDHLVNSPKTAANGAHSALLHIIGRPGESVQDVRDRRFQCQSVPRPIQCQSPSWPYGVDQGTGPPSGASNGA